MKFFNYKRHKFYTVFKNISFKISGYTNLKNLNFSKISKHIDTRRFNFSKLYRHINSRRPNFSKLYKYIDPKRFNFSKLYKYIDPKRFNFPKLNKPTNFKIYKYIKISLPASILLIFIYFGLPMFHKFDKSNIENLICKDLNVICSVEGKIKYSIFPTPRIKLTNLVARNILDNNKILAKIKDVEIKISLKNLHNNKALSYKKINLKNGEIIFDLKNLKKYKNILHVKFNLKNINFKKVKIIFLNDKEYITSIENAVFKYKSNVNTDKISINGNFLTDQIVINLKNNRTETETLSILKIKLKNTKLSSTLELSQNNIEDNLTKGNFSIKKKKIKVMAVFEHKDDQVIVKKGNLKNNFLDGKFTGALKFLPYFDFNIDLNLNTLNFNKLHNVVVNLDEEERKKLFKYNEKINGQLSLSTNKIYSSNSLFNSFESRIKFMNGNIFVEQMLVSLGKLGAADLTGVIRNDKKFANFKFEKNIFIDNLKKFYNKFGIYNKKDQNQGSIHVLGNFDLMNLNMRFSEILNGEKISDESLAFYEKEFNKTFLEDGYKSFFKFENLKKFVKLVSEE
jgi:Fe-S-cluster formation regulator IscX/YfhJ